MEALHPSKIDLGLGRLQQVADRLILHKNQARVITVAGTNGKGSCIRTMERVLVSSGKRVGAYTSPHLLKYNERIRICERDIDDATLCDAFAKIDEARQEISLTYFEFGTLAAFLIFFDHGLDYWLLEVGLGGRLDAVNLFSPDYAVITSIDLDHEEWLGDTREKIASEKLGILRSGIVCVCADSNPTPNMWQIFGNMRIQLYCIGKDFVHSKMNDKLRISLRNSTKTSVDYFITVPSLPISSVLAALQTLCLCGEVPSQETLNTAMLRIELPGRFECVTVDNTTIILDVAHNPAAVEYLHRKLQVFANCKIYAVVGMLADKKLHNSIRPLVGAIEHWATSEFRQVARSAGKEELVEVLLDLGVSRDKIDVFRSVALALKSTLRRARETGGKNSDTAILVFGSFYTVAEAHEFLSINK